MRATLHVLLIEDSQNDAAMLVRVLNKEYEVQFHRVDSSQALKEALLSKTWDVVLSDFNMPSFDAFEALSIVKKHDAGLPFIIISGVIGEEMAVQAMRLGAQDYLMKGNLARLNAAVARELKETEIRREISRLKSDFLNNINHEVMTPINGIVGLLEILSDMNLNGDQRSALSTLKNLTSNLHGIVSKMLDFSKLETRGHNPTMAPFDVRKMLNEIAEVVAYAAQKKNIKLSVEVHPGIPIELMGDKSQISLVLKNMVENAIKFTERGEIILSVTKDGGENGAAINKFPLKFQVQDTGIGIHEKDRSSIFLAFSQVDGSSTRKLGGTGLGLSICKRVIERLGGEIGFKSILGKGTDFWFTVSMDAAVSTSPQLNISHLGVKENKRQDIQILVVDDDTINLFVAEKLLKKLKHKVMIASGGAVALDILKENSFDLIFMDCQMPDLDGYQTTIAIRKLESSSKRKRTPIIAWTAHAEEHARLKCLEAGMDDYAPKPIKTETFARLVDKWTKVAISL